MLGRIAGPDGRGPGIVSGNACYVRPQFRSQGLGRRQAERIIGEALKTGYNKLRLETIEPKMETAVRLYQQLRFCEIRTYRSNPLEGALYLELDL